MLKFQLSEFIKFSDVQAHLGWIKPYFMSKVPKILTEQECFLVESVPTA